MASLEHQTGRIDEIIAYWGETLVKVPTELVSQYSLPHETSVFLQQVGLPTDGRLGEYSRLYFEFMPHAVHHLLFKDNHYIVIGEKAFPFLPEANLSIGLLEGDGRVFLLDFRQDEGILPVQFLNSDIASLLLFLQVLLNQASSLTELSKQENHFRASRHLPLNKRRQRYKAVVAQQREIIKNIRQDFLHVDPPALDEKPAQAVPHYWLNWFFEALT